MLWIVVCNFVLKECFDIAWYALELNVFIWYNGTMVHVTIIAGFGMVEV